MLCSLAIFLTSGDDRWCSASSVEMRACLAEPRGFGRGGGGRRGLFFDPDRLGLRPGLAGIAVATDVEAADAGDPSACGDGFGGSTAFGAACRRRGALVCGAADGLASGLVRRRGSACGGGSDDGHDAVDRDRFAFLDADLRHDTRSRRRDFGVHFVGGNLEQRLVAVDLLADFLDPADDRALGNRLAHLRHHDVSSHLQLSTIKSQLSLLSSQT